jgi:uncharacterized protein (TIGR00269 family)
MNKKTSGPAIPRCSLCREPSVAFQKQNGRHLCGTHFTADIEQRVSDTITTRKMIVRGDLVTVALSGGKDSTALLLLMSRLISQFADARLVALTIDEGISGYREETIHSAEKLTAKLGIEHHIISFSELFGESLDDILKGRETQACSICGILRKKALVAGAGRIVATKLATGHNLDDEAQSVLMNVFRGDLPRLIRNSGMDSSGRFIPRIKPLFLISEKEIALYLMLNNAWNVLPECPYTRFALRREVRSLLSGFEYKHPGTMRHLIESKQKIERSCIGSGVSEPLRTCRGCGDPSSGEYCQVCQLMQSRNR